ncbi:MAG: hypothetical protein E6J90_40870 [Deltaproteobacteria bacterium]|nr:MAG: hypothetical protein E6J90_40870 [Deltaproteobacteria bacterium]
MSGFVIVRKLAEGGMGAVYLAEHERLTHIRKVVKVLLPAYARHGELQQRFEREADAASRLHHDHILKIDNFGKLPGGQPWLMTEFLHGQPLDEFLRTRGRLAEHRALLVLLQLCSALEHAHKLGIIHRDLKPSNVFVCPTKQQPFAIKLLDFGIAKMLNEATDGAGTRSGAIMGTPSYMAVEQYDHAHAVTPHADIFSLGVMTCEMVTGRLPWGNHDQAVLYHKQRTERPVLEGLSSGWKRIIEEALAVEPRDRPESARAYAVALASETPPIPPYVPSGAEMLCTVAPDLVDNAPPDNETVRNQSNRAMLAPMAWSTLTPPEVAVPQPTTMGASVGVIVSNPQRRLTRAKLALASLGACGLAGLVTFTLARSQTSPRPETAPTANAPPSVGIASPSVVDASVMPTMSTARSAPAATAADALSPPPIATTPASVLDAPARIEQPRTPQVAPSTLKPPNAPPSLKATRRSETTARPAAGGPAARGGQAPPSGDHAPADERNSKASRADDETFDPTSPTGR